MIYFIATVFFVLVLFILNVFAGTLILGVYEKRQKIIKLERNIISKLNIKERLILYISDKFSQEIAKAHVFKLEKDLLVFLNSTIQSLIAGSSLYKHIENYYHSVSKRLQNILSILILNKQELNYIEASHLLEQVSPSIFVKIFFSIVKSYRQGTQVKGLLVKLRDTLKSYIQLTDSLKASFFQIKAEFYISLILPYLVLFVMSILYKSLISATLVNPIGILLILSFLLVHLLGIVILKLTTKIHTKKELKTILIYNYIALTLKTGNSVQSAIIDAENIKLIPKTKAPRLADKLKELNTNNEIDDSLFKLLKFSQEKGLPIADTLLELSNDKMQDFVTKIQLLKGKAQIKALFPMLLLIFPASYGIILTPIFITVLQSQ